MKLRSVAILFCCAFFAALSVKPASPHESPIDGASQRGEGAALRARVARLGRSAADDPQAAATAAEELLWSLRPRLTNPDDTLEPDTLLAVASEVAAVRTEALLAVDGPTNGTRRDFIRSVAGAATVNDWRYGVPASITVAQAILESAWGRSAPGYNYFGLKGEGTAGSVQATVTEYRRGRRMKQRASFRIYDAPADAIADHGEILGTGRRYARARAAGDDVEAFSRALVGVYATDPRYAGKLVRIIRDLRLDRFDLVGGGPWR